MSLEASVETKRESWPKAEVDQLMTLWESGLPASRIAAALGTGKSRNAILGKLHRLGKLEAKPVERTDEERERPRPPRPPRQQPSMPKIVKAMAPPPKLVVPPPVAIRGAGVTIPTLEAHHCRFPIGDPGTADFRFCGHARHGGGPYCEAHAAIAYAPTPANRNLKRSTREDNLVKAMRRSV